MYLITIICYLVMCSVVSGTWLIREDRTCDPTRSNILFPYTGFRIQRQYTYGLPILHHVRLSHCNHGKVDMESYAVTDRNTDIVWAQNMCMNTDSSQCYRLVRKKKYVGRSMSLYLPETQIGAIFQCPSDEECTNENARPVLPLMADYLSQSFFELVRLRRLTKKVPYLYTPNYMDVRYPHRPDLAFEWASELDVNENYTFSTLDKIKHLGASMSNKALNAVHDKISLNPSKLPWENDRLKSTT